MRTGGVRRVGAKAGVAVVAVLALVVSGCSSGGSDAASTTAAATTSTTTASVQGRLIADWKAPACDRAPSPAPEAKPVAGSKSDFDLISFDGTTIRIHWFPRKASPDATSPTVLMGPGWSLPGDTDAAPKADVGPQSVVTIAGLRKAGYNVATWDPRGFGESEGTVTVDSIDYEAKDVSTLIDWVSAQDGVQLDDPGNPRLGMVGMSYGGGIQYVTAASDCRVDVITPTIAWNSLATSLYPAETYKAGWGELLVSIAATAKLDPHITSANADATATGVLNQDDRTWFLDRGPDDVLADIHVPTLIVQGTVDNLFPLSEGVRNAEALSANGIPLAMTWFCGGHGVCNNDADPDGYVADAVMNWLARYLDDDADADTVPAFQTTDQAGKVHSFAQFPPAQAGTSQFAFADAGTLELQPEGGSGPATDVKPGDIIGSLAGKITPAKATKALEVPVDLTGEPRLVLGAPQLDLGYTCTLDAEATKPTRVFAQLVDDATGRVVGNQITPIAITCDGLLHQASLSMEDVAFAAAKDAKLTLQLVASTVAYAVPQMGGNVDFSRIELTIPTVSN
ncbi:MAG TPA: CocE/NonD family hydrolase [Acidimicrobiales bacterium]|nr:CocE/NonD family hydrolase [Acidimicrobiales bacterium]